MPSQMNILLLSGVLGDTRRYRTFHPYEQLSLAGVPCRLAHLTDPGLPEIVSQAGLVIFHRTAWDGYVERLVQRTRLAILDVDDLLFDPDAFHWIDSPDFSDPLRARLYQQEMHRHRQMLDVCLAVMASTEFLAGRARQTGKPARVHRNAFSMEMLALSEAAYSSRAQDRNRIVLGYASGTPTHDQDFAVAKPALMQVMQQHPEIELWLVGSLDPGRDWGELAGRVRRIPLVPWRELPTIVAQFDVNLAPLVVDNPFAQSKSEIKYLEAALLRVPSIASPTEAYQYAICSGENGYLAASLAEWAAALSMLVQQAGLRKALGEAAYAHVLENYHPARRGRELVETLSQFSAQFPDLALELPVSRPADMEERSFRIDPAIESNPTLGRRARYSLSHRGLRTLLVQVWVYIRRLLAPLFPFRRTR